MKFSILFACLFAFSTFSTGDTVDTVDTYDWTAYKEKSDAVMQALDQVVQANIILNNDHNVNFDELPKRTKSELAILQESAYLEWLMAEEKLGKDESVKYWEQDNEMELSRLSCYDPFEKKMKMIIPESYANIKTCSLGTRTACHLKELKKIIQLDINFYTCLSERFDGQQLDIFRISNNH